ncbi:MAG: phosphatidylserine decarboxylase [SAR324 cluster bacterium]|nr:phosphatidylserine decarboxylase [SAR324 cluster bacterium]
MFIKRLLMILPLKGLSAVAGVLANIRFPAFLLQPFLRYYCRHFQVKTDEMSQSLNSYHTFTQFFVRKLKTDARELCSEKNALLSPVDGRVSETGKILACRLLQAKGDKYLLTDLIGVEAANYFLDGDYMTIYLSPADYHRIHSPVDGVIEKATYFPGRLFPVNQWAVNNIGNLFCRNDRVLTLIKTKQGMLGLLKVGALIVGKIKLSYGEVGINKNSIRPPIEYDINLSTKNHKNYELLAGEHMAQFELGSTVIILGSENLFKLSDLMGKRVVMGEKIGFLN